MCSCCVKSWKRSQRPPPSLELNNLKAWRRCGLIPDSALQLIMVQEEASAKRDVRPLTPNIKHRVRGFEAPNPCFFSSFMRLIGGGPRPGWPQIGRFHGRTKGENRLEQLSRGSSASRGFVAKKAPAALCPPKSKSNQRVREVSLSLEHAMRRWPLFFVWPQKRKMLLFLVNAPTTNEWRKALAAEKRKLRWRNRCKFIVSHFVPYRKIKKNSYTPSSRKGLLMLLFHQY